MQLHLLYLFVDLDMDYRLLTRGHVSADSGPARLSLGRPQLAWYLK